jgi:hypothetical protein
MCQVTEKERRKEERNGREGGYEQQLIELLTL